MPGRKINPHRGWEIYEQGIYDIAKNIKENYGNIEWMLTENGMGVEGEEKFRENGMIQDDYRIDFVKVIFANFTVPLKTEPIVRAT